jgi:hypothetical protein
MIIAAATPANAQIGGKPTNDSLTAVMLYSACTHPSGETPEAHEFAEQTCSAYIRGLTDGLFMMQVFSERQQRTCLPSDAPIGNADARRIFDAWLKAHPEAAANSAGLVATYAIVSAYQCGKPR